MADPGTQRLVLASGSRFRRKMMEDAGLVFEVVPSDVDESAIKSALTENNPEIDGADVAEVIARAKAEQVSSARPGAWVIGADQVLMCDGALFSKPGSIAAARVQLLAMRGRVHTLPTAVVLARDGEVVWTHVSEPALRVRSFSHDFLDTYLAQEGLATTETVGGYALEGRGGQLFESVEGDYFSIIGLPLLPLMAALRDRDVLKV